MTPGDGGQVNDNVTALVPANHILPVGNGQLVPIWQAQPSPDLRLLPEGEQALGTAQENQQRQNRQKDPHNRTI